MGRSPSSLQRAGDGLAAALSPALHLFGGKDEPAASDRLPRLKRDLYRIAYESQANLSGGNRRSSAAGTTVQLPDVRATQQTRDARTERTSVPVSCLGMRRRARQNAAGCKDGMPGRCRTAYVRPGIRPIEPAPTEAVTHPMRRRLPTDPISRLFPPSKEPTLLRSCCACRGHDSAGGARYPWPGEGR